MIPSTRHSSQTSVERQALRRRVRQMYDWFDEGRWEKCFSLVDPKLREQSRVQFSSYAAGMRAFKEAYGTVHPWMIRISLHLDTSSSPRDKRHFAYVYVIWQDDAKRFHMFQERWVKDSDRWFTRVAGLVPALEDVGGPPKPSMPR